MKFEFINLLVIICYREIMFPIGHMINRPPYKTGPNCKLKYEKGLLYVVAKYNMNNVSTWQELYIAYNDNKI